jgi:hypothetical protein
MISAVRDLLRQLLGPDRRQLAVELRFGTDLAQAAVEALLAAVAGLPRTSTVVFEAFATEEGIRHLLRSDQATLDTICGQLLGLASSTRIEPARSLPSPEWRLGVRLAWSHRHALLRPDGAAEAAIGFLAALTPLARDEALLVQVALRPGKPVPLPPSEREAVGSGFFGPPAVEAHVLSGLRSKHSGPLLRGRVLVAVACGHPDRGAHLLGRVVSVFRSRRGAHGHLLVRRLSARGIPEAKGEQPWRTRSMM